MARKSRGLSPDDKAAWEAYRKTTRALDLGPAPAAPLTPAKPGPTAPIPSAPAADPITPFRVGQTAGMRARPHDLAPTIADQLRAAPLQMDAKQHKRMVRGKSDPQARLDLHGMTLAEAHPALISFILSSAQQGLRLVLVITGKGKDKPQPGPIPARMGVLRHQVPQWLRLAPLRQVVLHVEPAHRKHGGEGAYYVKLRRTG